jgi:hypothetical protein
MTKLGYILWNQVARRTEVGQIASLTLTEQVESNND